MCFFFLLFYFILKLILSSLSSPHDVTHSGFYTNAQSDQNSSTFLASILMAVTALHVIPLIVVFRTKCVYAVFFPEIVWLIFSPSCKVPRSTIYPREVPLRGDVVQSQPGFFSVVEMLNINIFLILADINEDGVVLSTFCYGYCPVCTRVTRKITEAIEIDPSRVTNIYKNIKRL